MSKPEHNALQRAFGRAGIPLEITAQAFVRRVSGGSITQIDIARARGREWILCFPGDGSELHALGVDAAHQQVVLSVLEPERRFQERVYDHHLHGFRIRERVTPADERRMLIGMDERHLFVAQLDDSHKPTSVREAHEQLAPRGVPGSAKRRKKAKIKRQGEWFFVPLTDAERRAVAKAELLIERKVALGSRGDGRNRERGRPHMVHERLRLIRAEDELQGEFARGWVRHPEHKTVVLKDWVRVRRNTEDRSVGATWVD